MAEGGCELSVLAKEPLMALTLTLTLPLTLPLPLALPLTQEPFMASIALRHELKSLFTQARGDVAEMQGRCRGDVGEM